MHIVTNDRIHGIENRTDANDGISEIILSLRLQQPVEVAYSRDVKGLNKPSSSHFSFLSSSSSLFSDPGSGIDSEGVFIQDSKKVIKAMTP